MAKKLKILVIITAFYTLAYAMFVTRTVQVQAGAPVALSCADAYASSTTTPQGVANAYRVKVTF